MYSGSYIAQQFVNGLNLGSIYALIAIGLTMVYGLLRLINFAHGDLMMLGAYIGLFIVTNAFLPLGAAVVLPMLAIGLAGVLVERIAYRPLRGAPEVAMLMTSLAVSWIIQNGMIMSVTAQPRSFRLPPGVNQLHQMGGVSFSTIDILSRALAVGLMALLTLFVRYTRIGIAMRAASENLRAAHLMGIHINQVIAVAFLIGSALAAVAGVLWAGKYGTVEPFMGLPARSELAFVARRSSAASA